MPEDSAPVVLGLDAAWGFAPPDRTSPVLAAAAGALPDVTIPGKVTELRIHGVSGSDGPTMLEHPDALQVAGDNVTGFYRRWSPDGSGGPGAAWKLSVPWKLEAYSWGGLTQKPLASACWLLLAPFMMYNVAYFMLPPPTERPGAALRPSPYSPGGTGHRVADALVRLLALAATVQFVSAGAAVTVSTVAWQAARHPGMLPAWMGWYSTWEAGWRIALALAAVAAAVALLWWISVTTASKYEARTSKAQPAPGPRLAEPGFWKGEVLVRRQRAVHAGAALAAAGLIAALAAGRPAGARWAAVTVAAAALAMAVVVAAAPLAARHRISIAQQGGSPAETTAGDKWCWAVLGAGAAALLLAAGVCGWTNPRQGPGPGALPGITTFFAVLLAVQVALLIAMTITVVILAGQARAAGSYQGDPPYLGGFLSALVAVLGFALGGLLSAVVNIAVARLIGTPEPSGFVFGTTLPNALAVPWPIYAFGALPIGLLPGAVPAAILLLHRYRSRCRGFVNKTGAGPSPVAAAYSAFTAGPGDADGDGKDYSDNRGAIGKAWATGLLAEDVADAVALVLGGGLLVAFAAEIASAVAAGSSEHPTLLGSWWHGLASAVALTVVVVAGALVTLLRQAYSDPSKRRSIGALWDVATFWPRAVHPLAPPCYAERAVPEVTDRVLLLTGHESAAGPAYHQAAGEVGPPVQGLTVPAGPVLLTGYSQGSIIAPAVVAQLPGEVWGMVALLTLACPIRRLYGRAFPAYFGRLQLTKLGTRLGAGTGTGQPGGRWKNLYRKSDFIGSWVFRTPDFSLNGQPLLEDVDQPCWDPVILVPDLNQTPPPIHRHSGWWPDPRTNELGKHLIGLL